MPGASTGVPTHDKVMRETSDGQGESGTQGRPSLVCLSIEQIPSDGLEKAQSSGRFIRGHFRVERREKSGIWGISSNILSTLMALNCFLWPRHLSSTPDLCLQPFWWPQFLIQYTSKPQCYLHSGSPGEKK